MKEDIKNKWVEALRSGEFEQGRVVLLCAGKHCCLGVLSELALVEGVCSFTENAAESSLGICAGFGEVENYGFLCQEILNWSGMQSCTGDLPDAELDSLTECNDTLRYDFNQIADVIEKHWEEL